MPKQAEGEISVNDVLSPAASLVFLPSISHDIPMMIRNAKRDACAKNGMDKLGDGACAALPCAALRVLVLVKEGCQAHKKLPTASDIYRSMMPLEAHQARHRLNMPTDVRIQRGHSSLTTTTAGTAVVVSLASSSTFPSMSAFAKPDDVVVLACCSAMSAEELRTLSEPQPRTSHHRTHCVLQSASWGWWRRSSLQVSTAKDSRSLAIHQMQFKIT